MCSHRREGEEVNHVSFIQAYNGAQKSKATIKILVFCSHTRFVTNYICPVVHALMTAALKPSSAKGTQCIKLCNRARALNRNKCFLQCFSERSPGSEEKTEERQNHVSRQLSYNEDHL